MTGTAAPLRLRRASVRARIAIACGGLFLVFGAILIGATYGLVSHVSPQPPPGLRAPVNNVSKRAARDYFQVGVSTQSGIDRRWFLVCSLAGLGLATVVAGGLGWASSSRVLRPLRAITEAARAASQENLDQRLALAGAPDELKELASTFDAMLSRLDAAFASQRRFVANASHELRTPLTEMRTLIDVTLAKPSRSARQLESALAGVRTAVDRSEELIEALLTLARSDRGLSHTEVVDLPTAVEDAIDVVSRAAAARQVRIDTALQHAQVTGDRVLLERLVSNLIDNAVRHNVTGGWMLASTRHEAGFAELTITSTGEEILPDQASGLAEPFRRLPGQAGGRPGTGLGLSIVASVAKAHGGQAEVHARPGGGLEVHVRLPATAHGNANGPDHARLQAQQ